MTWQVVIVVTVVVLGAHALIMPRWRYSVHRWEVTDQALYTRTGWFSVHWRIAPINRIQTIDSHRSLGERIFGLANVTATTASAAGPVQDPRARPGRWPTCCSTSSRSLPGRRRVTRRDGSRDGRSGRRR